MDVGVGRMCSAAVEHSSTGVVWRPESKRRLVRQARRALNWRRVIRWSEERGKIIFTDGGLQNGAEFGVVSWWGINGDPMLRNVLATETGKMDTICSSSTQHGISGLGLATLIPGVEMGIR